MVITAQDSAGQLAAVGHTQWVIRSQAPNPPVTCFAVKKLKSGGGVQFRDSMEVGVYFAELERAVVGVNGRAQAKVRGRAGELVVARRTKTTVKQQCHNSSTHGTTIIQAESCRWASRTRGTCNRTTSTTG